MQTSISGEPAAPHHVGIALRAILFGVLLGAGVISLAMWGARTLQARGPAATGPITGGPVFALVVGGTLGGIFLAVGIAWGLMRPLTSLYRRGGLAIGAGIATFAAMLPAMAADRLAGRTGLLLFSLACGLGCLALARSVAAGVRAS